MKYKYMIVSQPIQIPIGEEDKLFSDEEHIFDTLEQAETEKGILTTQMESEDIETYLIVKIEQKEEEKKSFDGLSCPFCKSEELEEYGKEHNGIEGTYKYKCSCGKIFKVVTEYYAKEVEI